MSGALLWGYDATNKVWIPLQVDANGYVKVDMSNINLDDLADVSVAAPADDDLFYYDDATGLWKSRKLVDADIPAGIARDTEVATAIADHADDKTGVHGVGSNYVAETSVEDLDLAAHQIRHGFLGADGINLPPLLSRNIQVTFDWQTHDEWTEAHTLSGNITWGLMHTILGSGATINAIGKVYTAAMGVGYWLHPGRSGYNAWSLDSYVAGLSDSLVWLGFFADTTPGDTVRHVGWKIIDGQIWASNSDGVTQTITDTGVSIAAAYGDKRLLIHAGTTAILFYINLVLKATHSTNLPGGGTLRNMMYITNTVAADKRVRVYFITSSMSSQY